MNLDLIVYVRDNSVEVNDGAYEINLREFADAGTHWVVAYVKIMLEHNLIVLVLLMFQKRLKHAYIVKSLLQMFIECKHVIQ